MDDDNDECMVDDVGFNDVGLQEQQINKNVFPDCPPLPNFNFKIGRDTSNVSRQERIPLKRTFDDDQRKDKYRCRLKEKRRFRSENRRKNIMKVQETELELQGQSQKTKNVNIKSVPPQIRYFFSNKVKVGNVNCKAAIEVIRNSSDEVNRALFLDVSDEGIYSKMELLRHPGTIGDALLLFKLVGSCDSVLYNGLSRMIMENISTFFNLLTKMLGGTTPLDFSKKIQDMYNGLSVIVNALIDCENLAPKMAQIPQILQGLQYIALSYGKVIKQGLGPFNHVLYNPPRVLALLTRIFSEIVCFLNVGQFKTLITEDVMRTLFYMGARDQHMCIFLRNQFQRFKENSHVKLLVNGGQLSETVKTALRASTKNLTYGDIALQLLSTMAQLVELVPDNNFKNFLGTLFTNDEVFKLLIDHFDPNSLKRRSKSAETLLLTLINFTFEPQFALKLYHKNDPCNVRKHSSANGWLLYELFRFVQSVLNVEHVFHVAVITCNILNALSLEIKVFVLCKSTLNIIPFIKKVILCYNGDDFNYRMIQPFCEILYFLTQLMYEVCVDRNFINQLKSSFFQDPQFQEGLKRIMTVYHHFPQNNKERTVLVRQAVKDFITAGTQLNNPTRFNNTLSLF